VDTFDRLAEAGKLPAESIQQARALQRSTREPLTLLLPKLGVISEPDLAVELAREHGLDRFDGRVPENPPTLVASIPVSFWRTQWAAPLRLSETALEVAVLDPTQSFLIESLQFSIASPIKALVATRQEIERILDAYWPTANSADEATQTADHVGLSRLEDLASEAPVIRWVQRLIIDAIEAKASDIHLEAGESGLVVRYRKDGMLETMSAPPAQYRDAIISRVKILAHLNIAERRLPQDGRIRIPVNGRDTDFRVVTSPGLHGESAVLRILDRQEIALEFDSLGLDAGIKTTLERALDRPYGIILVTGPTGSGKTTTLYAALKRLNRPDRKILTVEDPIEYTLAGIQQTQVRPAIGYTFAHALRSFLRQDPDIIMVGEIRDRETAEVAVQASLTGHLLLSTLHTNSAAGAVTRLLDMGVEDYLLTSTLNLLIGQRLVRKLCSQCKSPSELSPELLERVGIKNAESLTAHAAVGCPVCHGSGYRGRTAILEVLELSQEIQRAVLKRPDAVALEQLAVNLGMRTMLQHGLARVHEGQTTLEEILRVTRIVT
jgi:general secretion pathway protein E